MITLLQMGQERAALKLSEPKGHVGRSREITTYRNAYTLRASITSLGKHFLNTCYVPGIHQFKAMKRYLCTHIDTEYYSVPVNSYSLAISLRGTSQQNEVDIL